MDKKKLNILVTGAAGFIGSHLTDELLKEHCVTGLDNLVNGKIEHLENAFSSQIFTFIQGDILDPAVCAGAMRNIDIVYHLACLGVRHSIHSPVENHRVNAEGTLQLLEAARKSHVKKFFYISTSEVYGDVKKFPVTEEELPYPKTVYGSGKLAGEHYTYSYYKTYGLPSFILRIFNNYGPRAHYEGDAGEIIPRSIVRALYDQSPVIFGDGRITRDFFYVKDTARALAQLLRHEPLTGETINIGTGKEMSLTHLIEAILKMMGKESLGIEFQEGRPADVPRLWVDPGKFRRLTGYQPQYSFEEGLKETIAYYTRLKTQKNLLEEITIRNWEK